MDGKIRPLRVPWRPARLDAPLHARRGGTGRNRSDAASHGIQARGIDLVLRGIDLVLRGIDLVPHGIDLVLRGIDTG